jgi:hypothetical protein
MCVAAARLPPLYPPGFFDSLCPRSIALPFADRQTDGVQLPKPAIGARPMPAIQPEQVKG